MNTSLDDREPLLDDRRLERLSDRIKAEDMRLHGATFVTFVSEPRTVMVQDGGMTLPRHIERMATFAIIEPNPRPYAKAKGLQLMTHGTVAYADWEDDERKARHFVGLPDHPH